MQAPKNGFFYVVDRENGRLISAKPFVPMSQARDTPQGTPISWAYAIDPVTGRPLENPEARYREAGIGPPRPQRRAQLAPDVLQPADRPGLPAGAGHGLRVRHDPANEIRDGFDNIGLVIDPLPDDEALRAAIRSASKGMLLAWDPVAQREAWRSNRRGPVNGGTLVTAGGLVFQGTGDGQFLALDAKTGKMVWSADNQAATLAGPITYSIAGAQYVAVTAGYGGAFFLIDSFLGPAEGNPLNGRVYIFKLGGTAAKPVINFRKTPVPRPPAITVSAGVHAWRAALRAQLHGVPRRGGAERRRPPRSPPVDPDSGYRRLPPCRRRRRAGAPWHATLREVRVRRRCGTDPGVRGQAGEDGVRR